MRTMPVTEPVNLLSSSQSTDSAPPLDRPECLQIIVKRPILIRKSMRWMINEKHSSLGRRMQFSYLISRLNKVNDIIAKNSMCI